MFLVYFLAKSKQTMESIPPETPIKNLASKEMAFFSKNAKYFFSMLSMIQLHASNKACAFTSVSSYSFSGSLSFVMAPPT